MSRCRLRTLLLAGALGCAATLATPLRADTLSDALVKAYQTSPLLASSQAGLRAQDEAVPQARAMKRPQISASASAGVGASTRLPGETTDVYRAALDASLVIYDHGQTAAAIEAARYNVAAARADLTSVEQSVLFAAVSAYMDVRRDLEFLRIARSDVRVLEEQLRAANNRFEVGEVTRTDVSLTEARLAESRATLASAVGNVALSREAYQAAVGVEPNDLAPPPPAPSLPVTMQESVALALRLNPVIVSAQFLERAAIADFDRARAADGPEISITGSVGYDGNDRLNQGDDVTGEVGIGAQIPLYTGGLNSSLIRQAQSIVERRKFEVQEAGRDVNQQVNSAWIQIEVAQASIVANRRQLEAARVAFEGVSEEARLGARSTLDVLDSDQDRLEAEAEVVRAQRDAYVAAYALLQAVGLLTVEHLDLGIETYDPDVNFTRVQSAPSGGYDTSAVDRIRARWQK